LPFKRYYLSTLSIYVTEYIYLLTISDNYKVELANSTSSLNIHNKNVPFGCIQFHLKYSNHIYSWDLCIWNRFFFLTAFGKLWLF